MTLSPHFVRHAWLLVLLSAAGAVLWLGHRRAARIAYVSSLATEDRQVLWHSPTGYADGRRWLIAPAHANETYQAILETQHLLASGEPRLRRIDFDFSPAGRDVHRTSALHWCLGAVAWIEHALTGRPLGVSVEQAAVHFPTLLHLLLLLTSVTYTARRCGGLAAGLLAVGMVGLFPWAANFLPGTPHLHGLALACVVWSLLPLTAAFVGPVGAVGQASGNRGPWILAGVAGGLGLWVSAAALAPVLAGVALGAAVAPWLRRDEGAAATLPHMRWRLWAVTGATTSLVGYLIDFFPDRLELRLAADPPLLAVAWLAVGELLALSQHGALIGWRALPQRTRLRAWFVAGVLGAIVLACAWNGSAGSPADSLFRSRLDDLPSASAANVIRWLVQDGFGGVVLGTFLPLVALLGAGRLLFRRETPPSVRCGAAALLCAAGVVSALACRELRLWSVVDGILLASLPLLTWSLAADRVRPFARWCWIAATVAVFGFGGSRLVAPLRAVDADLTTVEAESLTERNLAHWLANRAGPGGAVILAPPFRTTGLCFHGGLRGLGSLDPENAAGLAAAVRLAREHSPETIRALLEEHGITHVILPSWDDTLVRFAKTERASDEITFVGALNRWSVPRWMKPVAYQPPLIGGLADHHVVVFELVDEQDPASALGQLVEYFLDMEQPDLARAAGDALRQYSADPGALVALAQLELARSGSKPAAQVAAILAILDNGYDQSLVWNRRVSLAVLLAQVRHPAHARTQLQRCLAEMDEARLRSLSTRQLYWLQVLSRRFEVAFPNPALHALALRLLPPGPRARIAAGTD